MIELQSLVINLMLKAVIFDMDGVLVDTEPLADLHFSKFLKDKFNVTVEPKFFERFRGNTSRHFWEIIIKEFGLNISVDKVIALARPSYLKFIKNAGIESIPGIPELISNLLKNNIKVAVASSASINRLKTILEIIKLSNKFEIIISADDIKNSKPHPEIYLKAAKSLKVDPKVCIAIEDAENGVKSAKLAGMKVIGYAGSPHNTQNLSEADLIIKSFSELNLSKLKNLLS